MRLASGHTALIDPREDELFGALKILTAGVMAAGTIAMANAQGTWTKKAPMAAAVNEVALAAVDTKIHVIGGMVLGEAGPYHQEYDIEKDTWRGRARERLRTS